MVFCLMEYLNEIKNVILERNDIEDCVYFPNNSINNVPFEIIVKCKFCVNNMRIPILIGIPENWKNNLFSFYILGYGYKTLNTSLKDLLGYEDCCSFNEFIPHVGILDGKICLVDLDSILIDFNFSGLLNQCIDIAKKILKAGIEKNNNQDFIKEFSSYIESGPNTRFAKLCPPENTSVLYYSYIKNPDYLIAASKHEDIKFWYSLSTIYKAAYFKFTSTISIYPPDLRKKIDNTLVNQLFEQIPVGMLMSIFKHLKGTYTIFFDLNDPLPESEELINVCFGIIIDSNSIQFDGNKYTCKSNCNITPIHVTNIGKNFLMSRTNSRHSLLSNLNILVIGCGSIGGYLADLLIKSGCEKLSLIDPDILKENNTFRHLLGATFVDYYKVDALFQYFTKSIPHITINPIKSTIEAAVQDKKINVNKFDFIFSVTGNQNINRWLENYIDINSINTTIIYGWNEPLDIGCHSVIVDTANKGRLSSLFQYSADYNCLYDITAYTAPNQTITKNNSGCGGSFIPYGSEVSLRTAINCLDLFKRKIDKQLQNNIIISQKGTGFYFKKSGLKQSPVYDEQQAIVDEKELS